MALCQLGTIPRLPDLYGIQHSLTVVASLLFTELAHTGVQQPTVSHCQICGSKTQTCERTGLGYGHSLLQEWATTGVLVQVMTPGR